MPPVALHVSPVVVSLTFRRWPPLQQLQSRLPSDSPVLPFSKLPSILRPLMDQPGQLNEPDDAQTQRALWRSAVLLLVVVAAVLAVFFWQGQNQPLDADGAAAEQLVPAVRFTDI